MLFAVRNLDANRVNLLMNDYAAGLPSPLAILGLAAAMAPQLDVPRWSIRVLPILHSVNPSIGRTKPEMKVAEGSFVPDEIMEDLTGTVRISLLIEVPGFDDEIKLSKALVGKRIAGGPILNDRIDVKQVVADGTAFRSFARGFAVCRPDVPERLVIASGRSDDIKAVADLLYPVEKPKGSGWLVPVAVGHHLIEDPATVPKRSGTRDPTIPHVFAEPLLGIAELVSVRSKRLTELSEESLSRLLWAWKAEGSWITGHPDYHPLSNAA